MFSGNTLSRVSATMSSEMRPLPQCLPLEPITLDNQKYTRSGEIRRVLGVPPGNASEDNSFGVAHPKPPPPVATEELKHFKESVKDTSRKARDRAKMLRESLFKLEKYREALSSKKRQRSDFSLNERSNAANAVKIGSQMHRNPHDIMTQRLEERGARNVALNKRVRTSVADVRGDNRSAAASRQLTVMEKGENMIQDIGGGMVRVEEKIRRLPAGGEGWDTKNKKKRSIGVLGSRVLNGDRDLKRTMHLKMNTDSKLRCSDAQASRSKSSPGFVGVNKLDETSEPTTSETSMILGNEVETEPLPRDRMPLIEQRVFTKGNNKPSIHDETLASSPHTTVKAKLSRAPRTGSIMQLDSSLKVHPSSTSLQASEQPASSNKVAGAGAANNHKRQVFAGSSSHAMTQWVGQRPHKNSRTRRANIVAPVLNTVETQISSQGFPTSDFSARTSSIETDGSLVASTIDNKIPKFKRELESIPSPFGLSESEESGAGDYKLKDKGTESSEVTPETPKAGALIIPTKKNKLPTNEIGDGVLRQGRSGRGSTLTKPAIQQMREKLENRSTKPLQSSKPASDKNKSKTGRPPSKKSKDKKCLVRVGPVLNSDTLDFTGEYREELFVAANSARKASNLACSGCFWKKMESIYASVSSEDILYLKQQLSFAEELKESLSQMPGVNYDVLGVLVHKEVPGCSVERHGDEMNLKSDKMPSLCGRIDVGSLDKGASLYQRVLSAFIEEDESEEFCIQSEGKNMPLHYASDDSHCGSCNLIDIETKDRDRMESEVESRVDFQTPKNCFMDRLSCDKSVASNTIRNSSMTSSLLSNEQWPGDDDFSHSDVGHGSDICSNDLDQLLTRESHVPGLSSSDSQYQLMCLEDRLLLELQSIGLYPETLPDLAEGEEVVNWHIMELKEGLSQQVEKKTEKLRKIDNAVQMGRDIERRNIEHVAMDQLIEMAYRKRLACRGNNNSKSAVRKVSKQAALAFVKCTLARCRKFEETGSSCFNEPALQEVIFSTPPCNNDAKSIECVGSGTASNICNEVSNHHAEARGSGAISSTLHCDNLDRGKKREALMDDVIGSASSRVTSTLDNDNGHGGLKDKRSGRDGKQNNVRNNSVSGASRSSVDGSKSECKTKSKPKQKSVGSMSRNNIPEDAGEELEEPIDFSKLPEFDPMGLEMSTDLGEHQDLDSWFNIDEDALQDHDTIGLDIPMDDLSELNMLM